MVGPNGWHDRRRPGFLADVLFVDLPASGLVVRQLHSAALATVGVAGAAAKASAHQRCHVDGDRHGSLVDQSWRRGLAPASEGAESVVGSALCLVVAGARGPAPRRAHARPASPFAAGWRGCSRQDADQLETHAAARAPGAGEC